ncbi:MAG: hypothetical protein RMZ69_34400 [Nostoc sp. ChiQUE01a]|nr:hypothetical protein [Nostoc sp. ChiQUE01a]
MAQKWNALLVRKMKVDGNGQAKILSLYELKLLFTEGFPPRSLFERAFTPSRSVWRVPLRSLPDQRSLYFDGERRVWQQRC